mgnify:FL=1
MSEEYIKKINQVLFSIDNFSKSMTCDEIENKINEASKIVKGLVAKFGYQVVFDSWTNYLKENVDSKRKAWNFMILFFYYDGHKFKIKDPYPFLGMLYKKLDLSFERDPEGDEENQMNDTFDSIYIELLINSGIVNQEDYFYMSPYNDERLIEAYNKIE